MKTPFGTLFGRGRTQHPNKSDLRLQPSTTGELLARSQRLGGKFSQVYRIDDTTVIKSGDGVRLAEAAALRFVREKTRVPVPKVLEAYIDSESKHALIKMEYIQGKPLDDVWDSYDEEQKKNITAQLKQIMAELRQIPGEFIGSLDGTYCEDQIFSNEPGCYGPFQSVAAFHEGLVNALKARGSNTWTDMVIQFIHELPQCEIVLTHNDLAPRNILVREAKVVAIVDWEFSGFYPAYWEYVKTMCWANWQSSWVKDGIVDQVLQPYIPELAYMLHARDINW